MKVIKPNILNKGDKVAAITLSWAGAATFPWRYEVGKKQFEDAFGCEVIETPNALKDNHFIYNHPKARADDLMWAFKNPDIKGIISIIGGDDSIRILPYIDFNVIKNNPKIFMGYSDSTVTHFICLKAGIESYYGPSFMSGFAENGGIHPYEKECVKKVLFSNTPQTFISNKEGWTVESLSWENPENQTIKRNLQKSCGWKVLQGNNNFEGPLIGGCIDVLDMINGTSIWPDENLWDNAILFLETSEEAPKPDTVKYWLRNYGAQGILNKINGLFFGRPGGSHLSEKEYQEYDTVLLQISKEFHLDNLPIISRMDFGHTDPMMVLPIGRKAFFDIEKCELKLI